MRKFTYHRLIGYEYEGKTGYYIQYIKTSIFWGLFSRTRKNKFYLKNSSSQRAALRAKWDLLIKNKTNL